MTERYYVRHYDAVYDSRHPENARPAISCIRDTWYCCIDVARIAVTDLPFRRLGPGNWRAPTIPFMRAHVEQVCAEWNAEHDAYVQARKGAGSF